MLEQRPPIVTVLGHVDHGKTTLLDTIRNTSIASREAGGITQKTLASQINTKDGKITFIDTPGHSLFSQMRSRGAKVADIVLLIVAADDGPKPQTLESLDYIKSTKTPFIVVFTKIDVPAANLESALAAMEKQEVYFEGRGGDVPFIPVSSKTREGIDGLLELILLLAEVNEIKADKDNNPEAVVIETVKDNRGTIVHAVVKDGTLKQSQEIATLDATGKIKGLFDEAGKPIKEAIPGDPVSILGFQSEPMVGSTITLTSQRQTIEASVRNIRDSIADDDKSLRVVLKAQNIGSLEAIAASLPKSVLIISQSVGEVSQNDVFLAKNSGAQILTFETKAPTVVSKLADTEDVIIKNFRIIYELLDYLTELEDAGKAGPTSKANILAIFPYEKKKVAGSKIAEGRFSTKDKVVIMRDDKEIGKAMITSIRKNKDVVPSVGPGEECGILMSGQVDFAVGDMILSAS